MRASRLVSIVLLLQARGRLTAQELAKTLEVSVRTIYRDMDSLNAAGIPVFGEPRKDGGFSLVDGYHTRLTGLTAEEAQALFLAGVPGAASALGLGDAAAVTQLKLMAAVSPTVRASAEHSRQRVHVDTTAWRPAARPDPWLRELHDALWSDRLIRMRYGRSTSRLAVIAPLGLVCKGTVWYLIVLRDGALRTYRVSRILDLTVTDETFVRPDDFDLVAHWNAASNEYASGFATIRVCLRLRGNALARADWVPARAMTLTIPGADGWAEAEFVLEDHDDALAAIGILGSDVIVVSPESLRHKAIAVAQAFVEANTTLVDS